MLATLGDLSNVGASALHPFLQELIVFIMGTLMDITAIGKQEVTDDVHVTAARCYRVLGSADCGESAGTPNREHW